MDGDPFAALDASPAKSEAETLKIPSGTVFVYDLETVPDESRFPRPARVEKPVKPDAPGVDLVKLQAQTVAVIRETVPTLSINQLIALGDMEAKATKPRQGVKDAVSEQLAVETCDDHQAAMDEWLKLGFNPLACRIVALGIKSDKHQITMVAKNDEEERELLRVLWLHIQRFISRCGYNITGFDDSVLIVRSMLLNVDATQKIMRKRFGDKGTIDLMVALFPNSPAQRLKEVCRMLGIVPPAGYDMDGSKVFGLIDAGKWDDVAAYVKSDAEIEFEIYQRLNEYMLF